jgi:gliding motility-associated-like protein
MSTAEQSANNIRITSSEDGCIVNCNGVSLGTINAGQTLTQSCTANSNYVISTSKPAMVVLYLSSFTPGGNTGDPASVIIPPLNRGVCESRFVLHNTSVLSAHRLYVICDTAYCNGLTFDGNPIMPTTSEFNGHRLYRLTVSNGGHTLQNDEGPFVAYAYGIGHYEGYAFPLGFNLKAGQVHDTVVYYDTVCQNEPYSGYGFVVDSSETATVGTLESWHQMATTDTVHHYHLLLTILPVSDTVIAYQIAMGDTLIYNGDILTAAGSYSYSFTNEAGCDSIVVVNLSCYSVDTIMYYDTVCQGEAYLEYGFNITTTQVVGTSVYLDNFGDSLHYYCLLLTVLPVSSSDTTIYIIMGDTLFFNGDTLTEAGLYISHYTAANGCDSTFTLHLVYEKISILASADGICPGDSATLTASGINTVWWSATPPDDGLEAQQGMTTIVVRPQQTTSYCIYSQEGGTMIGCITVGVEPPPELCIGLSKPFIDFDSPVVHFSDCSQGSVMSTWTFSEYVQPPREDVSFTARRVSRQFQYPLPDSVMVTLQSCNLYHCCADTTFCLPTRIRSIWWPNVFTPDEGQNNRFGCVTSLEIEHFELHIFNRQGLLVYHTTDPTAMWDGTRNGVPLQQGAYVYQWHVRDVYGYINNGTGTVTLIR